MSVWRWYCSLFNPPNDAKRQRWDKIKARGKKKFILRVGVLQWGGCMFVVMTALSVFRQSPIPRQAIDYTFEIGLGLLVWPIAGYIFGAAMWNFYETYFEELNPTAPTSPYQPK